MPESDTSPIISEALRVLRMEAKSVAALSAFVDESFEATVRALHACCGRVVVSGIGKSALIAQKIVATFNSTGTPALFLHAADAVHGDLGAVQAEDVVMVVSKSGESPEIRALLPLLRSLEVPIVALCGAPDSYLATRADHFVNCSVEAEACPHNLAPTTSTTAQLAMGDALAVCLLSLRGFTAEDFARYHPGGTLGKRLYLRVEDLLTATRSAPKVPPTAGLREVIFAISSGRLGATAVVEEDGTLAGIITDGDLRRMLERGDPPALLTAADILTPAPQTISADALAVDALELLNARSITQLIVTDAAGAYAGMVHLHDLLREGLEA